MGFPRRKEGLTRNRKTRWGTAETMECSSSDNEPLTWINVSNKAGWML